MIGATFFLYFMLHSGAFINRIFAVLNDENFLALEFLYRFSSS